METATNPRNFGYSVFIIYFHLLYFPIGNIDAQNIVPFPPGQSLNTPLSSQIANEQTYTLAMTGATTTSDNQTICTGFQLPATPSEFWIIQFKGTASASVVHHMTLYGCATIPATNPCRCGMENRSPLYSWVRNTPKVRYTGPEGSSGAGGFRIGGTSDKKYLFLEIHYCHAGTTNDQSGITIHTTTTNSGIFADLAIFPIMGKGTISANKANASIDTCTTNLPAVFDGRLNPFGFQVHTHNLGRLVSAYFVPGGESILTYFGIGNPQWPEAYVEISSFGRFSPVSSRGDSIYSRCVYETTGTTSNTNTNGLPKTDWQEMCIFNLLVYSFVQFSTKNAFLTGNCNSTQVSDIDGQASSTQLLTAIPDLDIAAAYGNITSGRYTSSAYYSITMEGETFTYTFS